MSHAALRHTVNCMTGAIPLFLQELLDEKWNGAVGGGGGVLTYVSYIGH